MSASDQRALARAAWEQHPNIGGPAGTLLGIHDQFRSASKRLMLLIEREPAEDLRWLRRAFMPLSQTLHHHHHAEEVMLFPMVHVRAFSEPTELVADHRVLTSAIVAVEDSLEEGDRTKAKAAIVAFDEILVAHLDREEKLVIPLLLQMTAEEAWSLLQARSQ